MGKCSPEHVPEGEGWLTTALNYLCCNTAHHCPPALPQTFTEVPSTSRLCAGSTWRERRDGGSAQHGSEARERMTNLRRCQGGARAVGMQAARELTPERDLSPTRKPCGTLNQALDSPGCGKGVSVKEKVQGGSTHLGFHPTLQMLWPF